MKTEVILFRDLEGMNVRQSTKTAMYNANDALSLYNANRADSQKEKFVADFLKIQPTKEIIEQICTEENIPPDEVFKSRRGKNGGTWMHPYLFTDFLMWLSPEFKYAALRCIHNGIISLRKDCGGFFKEMCQALHERGVTSSLEYKREAKMLNKIVFGVETGKPRDKATEKELDMLNKLQKMDTKLIKEGKTYLERLDMIHRTKRMVEFLDA